MPPEKHATPAGRLPPAKLKAAVKVVEAMAADWDPARSEDRHRARLQAAVEGADRTEHVDESDTDADAPDPTTSKDHGRPQAEPGRRARQALVGCAV